MGEPKKFKVEAMVSETKPETEEGNLKRGNEKGVGIDFTERYNQALESVIKEKFPDYIDPSTIDVVNNPDLMDKFQAMSQMKESLLRAVDEELKNPSSINVKPTVEEKPVFEPFSAEELETASTKELLKRGYSIFSPEYLEANKREASEGKLNLENKIKEKFEKLEKLEKIFSHLPKYNSNSNLKTFIDKIKNGKEAFIEDKKIINLIKKDSRFKTRIEKDGKLIVVSFDHTKEAFDKNLDKSKNIKKRREENPRNKAKNKIDFLFEVGGGPQAGETINISENGKIFQYHIIENDGKNMKFRIGDDEQIQIIGLRQAKEFLSKPGIDFTYAENSDEGKVDSTEVAETLNSKEQEDEERKLKLEIDELEKEILELEALKQKMEQAVKDNETNATLENPKEDNTNGNDINHEENIDEKQSNSLEVVTESMGIKNFEKEIDSIIRDSLGNEFENNGLDYENTVVSHKEGNIHTEIKFNYGKVVLTFDLVSQGDRAILTNDDWRQSGWNKFITLNKLNKKNAEQWCNIIAREFAKTKSKDNKPMKIDVKDGMLEIQHQI